MRGSGLTRDALALFVEMDERDIYFLETIVEGYDGIAQVRRDWYACDGRRFVKILVPPDFADEVRRVLEEVRRHVPLGEVRDTLEGHDSPAR